MRKAAGPELQTACLALEPLPTATAYRRDITRWTSGVKHGASAVVRCPAGSAVTTLATGALRADHVIHAVAPDSEFGYEGMYTGGLLDQRISGAVAGNDTPTRFAGGASDGVASQQFTPPDHLLLRTYESALAEARRLGVSSVALCALGTGVKGWKPAISAALGLEAVARGLGESEIAANSSAGASSSLAPDLRRIEFVVGGAGSLSDDCWSRWTSVYRELLGPPSGLERTDEYHAQARRGELMWHFDVEAMTAVARNHAVGERRQHGSLLRLERLREFQELWEFRERGKNGRDEPLTAAQELAATRRRTTR